MKLDWNPEGKTGQAIGVKQVTDWWLGSSGSLTSREEPELPLNAVFEVRVRADIRELCSVFNGNLGTHTYYTGKSQVLSTAGKGLFCSQQDIYDTAIGKAEGSL